MYKSPKKRLVSDRTVEMTALETAASVWKTATLHRGDPRVDVRAAELEAQSAELLAEAWRTLAAAEARRMYGCGCGVTECPGHLGATERAPRGRMDVLGANPLDRSETP